MSSMTHPGRESTIARAHTSNAAARPAREFGGRRWRTTTFRWLAAYAAIFTLAFMALLGLIEYSVTHAMEREVDSGLRWQLRYFDARREDDLLATIDARLAREDLHQNHYGLFAPDGRHIGGDIAGLPSDLSFDRYGRTHEHARGRTVQLRIGDEVRELRAMGEVRANGRRLVVARTLSGVRRVHGELLRALIGGGLVCLGGSLLGGLLISMRQMRRVAAIQRATGLIAAGDLSLRLPAGGRDELDMLAQLVNRMLDEVERLLGEVKLATDGIAHDLRTPLARLRMKLARVADARFEPADDALHTVVVEAREDIDVLLARFTAMLRIAELGARQRRSGFARVDLRALVTDLGDVYGPLAEEKSIAFEVVLAGEATVHADRALLFEAFGNLLDNAIKFTPERGVVSVRLETSPDGPRVTVSDSGPGIPAAERDAVLGRLYRASRTQHLPGTGLGLGIVAAIVRLHDFALHLGGSDEGAIVAVDCWPHHP